MVFDLSLLPLFISATILFSILLVVAMHIWKNFYAMLFLIPLSMTCIIFAYQDVVDVLGYPVSHTIPNDSIYVHHIQRFQYIYVWVIEPGKDEPKSFRIDANPKSEKAFDSAQRKSSNGITQGIENSNGGEINLGEYQTYDFQIRHRINKSQ